MGCELILLGMMQFPFVLYLVITVRKFDSSLVTYWKPTKLEQWKVIERVYVFSASFARKYQYYHRAFKARALLGNNQYNFIYRYESAGQYYNRQSTNKSIENVAS